MESDCNETLRVEFLPYIGPKRSEKYAKANQEWRHPSLQEIEAQWLLPSWWNHLDPGGNKVSGVQ